MALHPSVWNVAYENESGQRCLYQATWSNKQTAQESLKLFLRNYFNEDGSHKAYPNGKGHYSFSIPYLVCVNT